MRDKKDYTGERFGLLTVLECIVPANEKNGGGIWHCKCKCGKTISLSRNRLYSRTSCGCRVKNAAIERGKNNRKSEQEKAFTKEYNRYKKAMRYRGMKYLDKVEWEKQNPCSWCNQKGCTTCEQMKGSIRDREFLKKIQDIARFRLIQVIPIYPVGAV